MELLNTLERLKHPKICSWRAGDSEELMVLVPVQEQRKTNVPSQGRRLVTFPLTQPFCFNQVFK